jgi:hypothetical protein
MTPPTPAAVVSSLARHPHLSRLAEHVRQRVLEAAANRSRSIRDPDTGDGNGTTAGDGLSEEESVCELGNVAAILQRGAETPTETLLLAVLVTLGVASALPSQPEEQLRLVSELTWLTAHTELDPLRVLDDVLGERAAALWPRVAQIVEDPKSVAADFTRAEALAAAAALSASPSETARQWSADLAARVSDPLVRTVLCPPSPEHQTRLSGELAPPPRHAAVVAVLGLTGILALLHIARLTGRYALALRRPVEVRLGPEGLELSQRTELLGRVLRDRRVLVPLHNLQRVAREVRYSRLGLYVGLFALAVGTYLGIALFVDGVRVPGGSPPLLGMGVLLVLLGLGLDFGLSSLSDTARGKCRLVILPRKGKSLCVAELEPRPTDALLRTLAEQVSARADQRPS